MAARRKAPQKATETRAGDSKGAVRLEDVLSKLNVFGGSLEILKEQLASGFERVDREIHSLNEKVASGFERVDREIHSLNERLSSGFAQVERRFEQVDQRFDQIDRRFEKVDREMGLVKAAALENSRDIREIRTTVTRIESKKVDRDEVISIVEQTLARR
jgi:methyl-accepting chemotaxis protein